MIYALRFFSLCLLFCICFGCTNPKNKRSKLIDFAPEDTQVLLKCNSIENLTNGIKNNHFFNTVSKNLVLKKITDSTMPFQNLNFNDTALLCFSKDKRDSITYSFIGKQSPLIFQTKALKNYSEEVLKYKSKTILKSTLNTHTFYSTVVDSVFILSSSKPIIDALFSSKEKTTALKQAYNTLEENSTLSFIFKPNATTPLLPMFRGLDSSSTALSDYIAVDIETDQNTIFISGIAQSKDSIFKTLDLFKNTIPQGNQLQNITPSNADGYLSMSFNEFSIFYENLNKLPQSDSLKLSTAVYADVKEIGLIFNDSIPAIVLNSSDTISTNDGFLDEKNKIQTYRSIPIFNFSKPHLFSKVFAPFAKVPPISRYCIIDHYFIFAKTTKQLQEIIASYQNKTVFGNQTPFKTLQKHLSNESSLVLVGTSNLLEHLVYKDLSPNQKLDFKLYDIFGLQFIHDSNFAHVNGALLEIKNKKREHSISEIFSTKLDAPLLSTPQFVTNHNTRQKEIVVQDSNHSLYLISNKGKILWQKKLDAPILGPISQIDIYKNGRLQLAFTTKDKLYVLDRKGREVAPFPLVFQSEITQPLSVFDYDNNKTYRLLVTQNKSVVMYDVSGKKVNGFTFTAAAETINTQPKHFRIGTKDYIVLKTQKKLYILNRVGKTRVTPKTTVTYANTPVFRYQNKFATTTSNGAFITIDTKGQTSKINLNLSSKHHLVTTNKTRVTFHDNKLSIKSRNLDLDYGNYSEPKIFYVNNKIFVAITNLDSKKLYLFDSLGNLIPNFPVFSNSAIDLDNIDTAPNIEIVTQGNTDSIILYQVN